MRSIFLLAILCVSLAAARRRSIRDLSSPHSLQVHTNANSITLNWDFQHSDPRSSLHYFTVKYRKRGESGWHETRTRESQVILSNLEFNTRYELQVQALLSNGESYSSTLLEVPVGPSPSQIQASRQSSTVSVPRNLRATVTDHGIVHLSWENPEPRRRVSYEVTVTESGSNGGNLFIYDKTSAVIGMLSPGQTYNFEVRTKRGDELSYPAAVSLTLPQGNQPVIKPTEIKLESDPQRHNSYTLSWTIAEQYLSTVSGYTVYHSDSLDATTWQELHVGGSSPSTSITLEPGQDYYVRIVTNFRDHRASTSSPTFKFRTPEANLIGNIKLIYNSDQTMRLEWIYTDGVDIRTIDGVQVLFTENKNLPENQWRILEARRGETSIAFPQQLEANRVYYFKIHPRVYGKGIVKSQSIFEISTRPQGPSQQQTLPSNLYQLRYLPRSTGANGRIMLEWNIPQEMRRDMTEVQILYSYDRNQPQEQWNVIRTPKETKRAIIEGVDTRRDIFFIVKPIMRSGSGDQRIYRVRPSDIVVNENRAGELVSFEYPGVSEVRRPEPEARREQRDPDPEIPRQKCLIGCRFVERNGRQEEQGCFNGSRCVEHCEDGRAGCRTGYCLADDLLRSFRNYRG